MSVPLAVGLSLVGVACLVLAGLVWGQRRGSAPTAALALLLLAMAEWNLAYSLYWADAPAPSEHFWLLATYLGVVVAPTAVLVFAARFSGRDAWITPATRVALAVEPAAALVVLWLDPTGQLVLVPYGEPGMGTIARGGVVFWLNVCYSYAALLAAAVLLTLHWRGSAGMLRRQAGAVLLGLLLPWLANIVMILGSVTVAGADPTPVTMAASAAAFSVALLRYQLLDLVRVDRHVLLEQLQDGILVLDARGRISDLNAAAARMLAIDATDSIGRPAGEALTHRPSVREVVAVAGQVAVEVELESDPQAFVTVRVSRLTDRRDRVVGRLVVLHDVTIRKRLEQQLSRRANTDPLTGVGNRRLFDDQAKRELARARRTSSTLSLALLDLDRLKELNDTRGHQAGDAALAAFADALQQCVRSSDLIARIGGDEFAVLMPDTTADRAVAVIDRVREVTAGIGGGSGLPAITLSAGVASTGPRTDSVADLVADADAALYRAKNAGRDRTVTAPTGV